MVYMFLADGFEEIEALAVVDILRRGGVEIKTISINNDLKVKGAHDIFVLADDIKLEETARCIILPGGLPGTTNLAKSEFVESSVRECYNGGGIISAICAGPSVFYDYGLLNEKRVTSYPDYKDYMKNAIYTGSDVEVDGSIVTSKGAGTAHLFGFKLLEMLKGKEVADKIKKAMQYKD